MSLNEFYYISNYDLTLAHLPMEILINIFKYLNPSDLCMVNRVCHRWFDAAQHYKLTSKLELNFEKILLCDTVPPFKDFLLKNDRMCQRNYSNIVLDEMDCGNMTGFWSQYGKNVNDLTIRNCDIRESSFIAIVKELRTLKKLTIENCRELFMPGRLLENVEYKKLITNSFENITALNLTNNRYLSDAIFYRIVNLMPSLTSLDLSACNISFHHGLCHRFYPKPECEASESVLTFNYILNFIKERAEKIKTLKFSLTLIDGTALTSISAIPHLQLTTLILRSCDQLTKSGIINLIQTQVNTLTYLDLSMTVRLTDTSLIEICNSLKKLQALKIRRCRALTDLSICEIIKLKNLQILDISECELITGKGLIDGGIASEENLNITELYLSALNICETAVIKVAENLRNLRLLDISYCKTGVTNLAVQLIFKYLTLLRTLNLEYCDGISDAAMTGVNMIDTIQKYELSKSRIDKNDAEAHGTSEIEKHNIENQEETNQNINESHELSELRRLMKNNDENSGNPYKISLRSKAETDIVMDAKRKKCMLEMYEKNANIFADLNNSNYDGVDNCNGYSINRLKGLRRLNLTACNKISDVSLKYSLRFNELQELSLARCQQISIIGIESLLKACPSIEILNLSDCHNINDKTIELITKYLKRLTHLYLKRCIQLTDHTLDYVAVNCNLIKHLDVDGCRLMCAEPNLRLVSVSSLKYNLIAFNRQDEDMCEAITYLTQNYKKKQQEQQQRQRNHRLLF